MYICKINFEFMEQMDIFQDGVSVSRVVSGEGLSLKSDLGESLKPYNHIFVVVDRQVVNASRVVSDLVKEFLAKEVPVKVLDVSETSKTMDTVLDICSWLLEQGADRDALVVAVGGGITTDMTGFAASIYKRGVRYANVPTTLLAQVDAALGGKTGVNHDKYKNILGVICQPEFAYMCPQVLESLPRRDFLSGAAEMLKTFIIEDGGNYQKAADMFFDMASEFTLEVMLHGKGEEKVWQSILQKHRKTLSDLITAAAHVKAAVVSRDPFEKGERRKLNLGHTFAHAIETLAQRDGGERYQDGGVTHGEAVAMGMVLAAKLADRYYRKDRNEPTELEGRLSSDLWDCNIPCFCPYTIEEMAEAMKKDKKAEGSKVHFVLPKAIGEVETVALTVEEVCRLMA
jgi:3-dehydroquinate synthetase